MISNVYFNYATHIMILFKVQALYLYTKKMMITNPKRVHIDQQLTMLFLP